MRNVNNFDGKKYGVGLRNKLHDNALETFKNGFLKEEKEKLLNETKKRKLIKRGGLGALAVGGAVAAGIGAKKMMDKKKAKKEKEKIYSEVEQKEFNSKAQKLLRNKHDIKVGIKKKIRELTQPGGFKPELVGKETIVNAKQYGRGVNKTPKYNNLNPTIHEKISRKGRIREFQKEGIYDDYTADQLVHDTLSPDLHTRMLIRNNHK